MWASEMQLHPITNFHSFLNLLARIDIIHETVIRNTLNPSSEARIHLCIQQSYYSSYGVAIFLAAAAAAAPMDFYYFLHLGARCLLCFL